MEGESSSWGDGSLKLLFFLLSCFMETKPGLQAEVSLSGARLSVVSQCRIICVCFLGNRASKAGLLQASLERRQGCPGLFAPLSS